jgi:hypothetical protein
MIDEVRRVSDLWLAIKHMVDREPRPGAFLRTGSARLLGLASLPDALPGRSETIELWPLSQGEIDEDPDGFVDAVFEFGAQLRAEPRPLRRKDYLDRAAIGGYPEAFARTTPRRSRFFEQLRGRPDGAGHRAGGAHCPGRSPRPRSSSSTPASPPTSRTARGSVACSRTSCSESSRDN